MKTELETQAVKKLAIFLSLGAVLWLALKFVWAFAEDILLADMRFNAAFGSTLYSTDLYSMDYWLLKEGWNVLTAFLRMAFVSFWLCWGVVRAMTACVSVSVGWQCGSSAQKRRCARQRCFRCCSVALLRRLVWHRCSGSCWIIGRFSASG